MTRTRLWALILLVLGGLGAFYLNSTYKTSPFKLGLDLNGGIHLVYKADTSKLPATEVAGAMETLKNVIEARVNAFGVSEPVVQTEESTLGDEKVHKLVVELPGVKDTQNAIDLIGQTPVLEFALIEVGTSTTASSTATTTAVLVPTELTGRYITTAQVEYDGQTGRPTVGIVFNKEGADIFAKLTKENIGEQLAILLDGTVITAPTIQAEIVGGKAQITGQYSVKEANELARSLKYGALPVGIELIGTQTIGASLGSEALQASIKAGLYGFIIIALFLMLWYRGKGIIAALALIIYVIINLIVFKVGGIVLTSAGLAAFIISLGMAVDGNILIFERMKEEIKRGKTKAEALSIGFARAWPSIRDSNISSMITAIILYTFAASPLIKGFAVVFLIGVAVSMFTAITASRTFLGAFTKNK
ncbi:MAG: protein translocase subunit SecD [Patescibacteria group bacterium]